MGAVPLERGARLCGLCSRVDVHELLDSTWTPNHGVVETYRCAGGHEWRESRLPLDHPKNISPRARAQKEK